ncbi:MAG: ABC transporter permease [Akkermansiaceae bacterium]|nr:ABC transporter permease [Akkermansiaceae bacterium]NNM29984.1 ABC transporter permease [Akkermansiaceae bacterium]
MKSSTPTAPDAGPVVRYGPDPLLRRPGALLREMATDLLRSRELAWRLFVRDVSARYRQSILGYVWAFLPPIAATATFVFLRSTGVFSMGETAIPYAAFALIGMVLWQTFVDAMQYPLRSLTAAKPMLTKINFPREAILLAALGEVLFNFIIRLVLLVAVFLWFQISPPATAWLFPFGVVAIIALGYMIGILLAPLGMLYQDVGQGLTLLTTFWLFVTPVLYPAPQAGLATVLNHWNPVSPLVTTSRDWLTTGPSEHLGGFLGVFGVTVVLLLAGWTLYRLALPHLIARMGG